MFKIQFFTEGESAPKQIQCENLTSDDIRHILSQVKPNSLLILDLDDTVGRVSQTIGLDPWFRARIQQYINEGHPEAAALQQTIVLYNLAQLASTRMVPVDPENPMSLLMEGLKAKNVKVIGLTARNHELAGKTLALLASMNVSFSDDVLRDGSFELNGKQVIIQNGVIFANGNHKGQCIELASQYDHFMIDIRSFPHVSFVDDSKRNCDHVAESLNKLQIVGVVWHYTFAENKLKFGQEDKARAAIQEAHLLTHKVLLDDAAADERLRPCN